jgi:hypothetical protein
MAQLLTLSTETQETLLEKIGVDNIPAQKLVRQLAKYIGGEYDLNVRKGFEFERDGVVIQTVILSNEADTLKVIYTNTNGEETVLGSVIVEENGKKILKGYEIIDETVVKTSEKEVNADLVQSAKEMSNREIPNLGNREEVTEQAPCLHGNWCGPLCSGPGAPTDAVDYCCKNHDKCYGSRGYFACSCDNLLQKCLSPFFLLEDVQKVAS